MGLYRTIYEILSQSPSLTTGSSGQVKILFGERQVWKYGNSPSISLVPLGGPIEHGRPGYPTRGLDPNTNMIWQTIERWSIYCWARSHKKGANEFDHMDEMVKLRQNVLIAFQYARSNGYIDGQYIDGPMYYPLEQGWILLEDAQTRMGSANVMAVELRIPLLDEIPDDSETTIIDVEIENTSIDPVVD